jgi:hypothetical protein
MTRTKPSDFEAAMLRHPCRYCGAGTGHWCVGPRGTVVAYMHAARFYEVEW